MASRTRQAILGFVTDSGGQAVLQVAALITTPIILHLTSGSLYGFWLTALSVLAYLGLVDLGLGVSLTRIVAVIHDSSSDGEQLNRVSSTAFFSFCLAGLVFLVVGLGMGHARQPGHRYLRRAKQERQGGCKGQVDCETRST